MSKGHNSGAFYGGLSAEHLRQFVERLERLEEEKKNIADDIKEVFAEAKSNGFDVKTLRAILKLRKVDPHEQEEFEYLFDTYKRALGMLPLLDEDDNPAIKANRASFDIKKGLSALSAIADIVAFGEKVRKVAKDHGMQENYATDVITAKALEVYQKIGLPIEEVIAAMEGKTFKAPKKMKKKDK